MCFASCYHHDIWINYLLGELTLNFPLPPPWHFWPITPWLCPAPWVVDQNCNQGKLSPLWRLPTCEATCELSTPFSDNPCCSTCRGGDICFQCKNTIWICDKNNWRLMLDHMTLLCVLLLYSITWLLCTLYMFSALPHQKSPDWLMSLVGSMNRNCVTSFQAAVLSLIQYLSNWTKIYDLPLQLSDSDLVLVKLDQNLNKYRDCDLPTSPTRPSCLGLNVWTRLPPVCSYPLCLAGIAVICERFKRLIDHHDEMVESHSWIQFSPVHWHCLWLGVKTTCCCVN